MNRALLLSVLTFLIIVGGLAIGNAGLLTLVLPLVVFLFAGWWWSPEQVVLSAERKLSAERVFSGDDVVVTLEIMNNGPNIEELMLEDVLSDRLELVEGSNKQLCRLQRGETVKWSYKIRGQRGYFMLHEIRATVRDALGLSASKVAIPTDGQLFIIPPVLRLRHVSIRPRRTRIFSGTVPAHQGGPGVEFFDVREYQTGDSPRSINWKLTARHQQNVFSNQYEQERVVDVGIILDGRRRTTEFGSTSIFEHSVMATAALADAFLSAGNRVGLLFYGKQIHWTMPGYGKVQGAKILHSLSFLEPGDSQAFSELYIPRRLFPAKSQLVLVSPLNPIDFRVLADLRSRGYALMVISPDPVAFETSSLFPTKSVDIAYRVIRMKQILFFHRLRSIGVQVVNWDVSQPFEQVARRELERRKIIQRGDF